MEMATTTTTTSTTSEEHGESIESADINNSSSCGVERRKKPCSESSLSTPHITGDHAAAVIAAPSSIDTYSSSSNNNTIIMEALPLRKHTSSTDNMMDISFVNLREEDADILELGVEEKRMQDLADFDQDGRRLEATSHHRLSSASLTDLVEGLSLEGCSFDHHHHHHDTSSTSDGYSNNNNTTASCDIIAVGSGASPIRRSIHEDSMPVIAEDSSISIPHSPSCCTAEGIFREGGQPQDDTAEQGITEQHDDENEDDYFVGLSSPESQPKDKVTADEVDIEALALRIASGRAHNRSVSFDRRMIESAQFAEAVGEDPSLLLQKIIEQDSSSDFDDDDIDEEGDMLGGEDEFMEELQDYKASTIETVGSSDVGDEDAAGSSSSPDVAVAASSLSSPSSEENNNTEPKCVSTDLSRVSPKEEEEVCNRLMIERKQSFDRKETDDSQLLSNNSALSAPPTPLPSPAKARISPFTSFHPPYVDWKFQRQHSSSASLDGNRFHPTMAQTNNNDAADFRGIRLPEITKRGVARGNYAQLHRKAWLEVSDKHHRYGKNLRMYYKHWESLGHPYHMFFDWLDAKGEAQGTELPNLPEIPRSVLDSDTVQYITDPGISASYALDIVADPADGSAYVIDRHSQTPICTGKEGWIFVLRDHVFYGSQKVIAPNKVEASTNNADEKNNNASTKSRQRFHHSSFFGGKAVASAGIFLTDEQGRLTHLYPHSGHYRPGEAHVQRVLFFMQQLGVELSTFVVDMQQLFKVSRKFAPKGGNGNDAVDNKENAGAVKQPAPQMKKAKKTDCLHLMCGLEIACFLAHKALMIERGVFHQIHKIRRIPPDGRSVRNILNHVN